MATSLIHDGFGTIAVVGTVEVRRVNIGSKSECDACFLVNCADADDGKNWGDLKLYAGDNPFMVPVTLKDFIGKKCQVFGWMCRGELTMELATDIKVID
jgi:hypothetical protein